jgi:hypothetical protein
MKNISVRMSDFVPARLVWVAGSLKQLHSDCKEIRVFAFRSFSGAKACTTPLGGDWVGKQPLTGSVPRSHSLAAHRMEKERERR